MRSLRRYVISAGTAGLGLVVVGGSLLGIQGEGVAGAAKGGAPLKVGIALSLQGETSYAVNSYYYGTELGIDQTNKAGGVNGRSVQSFRVPTPATPTGMGAALLKIASKHPNLIIGFDNPTVATLTRQVNEVGLPIIAQVTMPLVDGYPGGSKWMFQSFSSTANLAQGPVNFAKGKLHAKSVAVLHTSNAFGTAGSAYFTTYLKNAGIKETTNTAYTQTATDMTQPVLATQGADAVIDWGYPAPLAAQVNLMQQNGSSQPTIGPLSVATDVASGAIKPASFGNVYAAGYCNPVGSSNPKVKAFVKAYKAKFGTEPTENAALGYDSALIGVAAAKKAKDLSPADLRTALKSIHVSGLCSNAYYSDANQVLLHEVTILGFSPSGQTLTKAVYNFPGSKG